MKKHTILIVILVLVLALSFTACKKEEPVANPTAAPAVDDATEAPMDDAMYTDGVYYARDEIGASWTYFVIVTVDGGKIVDAYWGGTNFVPQGDKRVKSEEQARRQPVAGNGAKL